MKYFPNRFHGFSFFSSVMNQRPHASASIYGSGEYPDIYGQVLFFQTIYGVLAVTEVFGLPCPKQHCHHGIFAYHIHEGGSCSGNGTDPFGQSMAHYNPENCSHPDHAGDLPPLFANEGYAFSAFLTDRFTVDEITGRTVIIHSQPDDFTTRPSGNSGIKIACGVIQPA